LAQQLFGQVKKEDLVNKKIAVSAVVAAFLATSASAFAQDHNHHNDRGDGYGDRGYNQRDHDRGDSNVRWNDRAHHVNSRGAGLRHDLHKGARLPYEYRNNQYVVNDWRSHRLSAPPRGYHWVQTGGDYVLAAVATGLIAQILLNS
jgi:Ni/Co efflux regulator RcnB